ncbi:MAG: hypothetical protein ACLFWD_00810 [Anaerolineales bacterium]
MKRQHWDGVALGLSLLAVALTAWVSLRIFEGLPHIEDEFANLWQAEVMAEGDIRRETPAEPKSFIVPFVVDHEGWRFGKYPPGWPALLSLGVRAGAGSWVNPLLAGLACWLTYRLAGRWLRPGLALLAAVLLTTSPMFLMLSGSLMSHNLSLALTLAFSLAWLDLFGAHGKTTSPNWLLALVIGGSLGLLVLTRPLTAVGVSLPFITYGSLLLYKRDVRWHWLLISAGVTLAVSALLLIWQYALTGDPLHNPYTLWWEYDRLGFGPDIGMLDGGHNLGQAWINTHFSLRAGMHDAFGWPFLSWLFLPLGLLVLLPKPNARPVIAMVPLLILAYGFYWIGSWLLGPRYYYEALPALAVISAAGAGWLGTWLKGMKGVAWRRLGAVALLAFLLAANLIFYLPARVGGMHGLYGIERQPLAAIKSAGLGQSLIIVHADHWSDYANLLLLRPPFADSSIQVAWSRGPGPDAQVAELFQGYDLYHYFDNRPGVLHKVMD